MKLFSTLLIEVVIFLSIWGNSAAQNRSSGYALKSTVEVTLILHIPPYTPPDDTIYLYGSMNDWDPGPGQPPDSTDLALSLSSSGKWEITLQLEDRTKYEYKYTRGNLETLENNTDSTESAIRSFFVDSELIPLVFYDTVFSWTDFTLPPQPMNTTPVLSYFNSSPQTSLAVTWATDSATSSSIYYGINDVYENRINEMESLDLINPGDALIHNVTLDNLLPNTSYKYKVVTEGVYESPEYTFTTAEYTNTFEFAVMGDNRPGIDTSVMRQVIDNKSSFVLHLGDLVQNGLKLNDWYRFLGDYAEMLGKIPTMAIFGNHEVDVYLNEFFKFPSNNSPDPTNHGHWYSFDYNNIHIVALDPYRDYFAGSEQYNWLIEDLESIPENIDHTFILIHEPPYTSGNNHGPNLQIRETLVPVFEEYNVDVVFNGHEHIYERSMVNNIPYIVTGGAGSPLYHVTGGANLYSIKAESVFHYCRVIVDGKNFKIQMVRSDGSIGDEYEAIKEIPKVIPVKIRLEQNYPNPFNPITSIRFSLVDSEHITLKIYDIIGREVRTLANELRETGIHEIIFNAGSLASGVYFYKLTVGNEEFIKKLMVLK